MRQEFTDSSLREELHRLSRNLKRGRSPSQGNTTMSYGNYRLLNLLKENDGITTRELAELLDIRPSSLTEQLSRLEQEETLCREKDSADQRIVHVFLQEKGRQRLAEHAEKQHPDRLEGLLESEERAEFIRLCRKLSSALESMDPAKGRTDRQREGYHGRHGHKYGHHSPSGKPKTGPERE